MKSLGELLEEYNQKDYYPFHMPGHKRNPSSVSYRPSIGTDITEIEKFDNLHHPEGILKEAQERAAKLYHTKETLFSVNGSTGALLSAISACTDIGGKILMARNCHKAVYHGVYIRQLDPIYLYPQIEKAYGINGGILPEDVEEKLLKMDNIQAVVITSPTYDGVVSDIEEICKIAHRYQVPVIVDEAHGAHFIFHEKLPDSALNKGADIVVHSLHKTLPAMTQTALLHRNSDRISGEKLRRYMGIYQSSSPSYPLMASIDSCICNLLNNGWEDFKNFIDQLEGFYNKIENLQNISFLTDKIVGTAGIYDWDLTRILLYPDNLSMTTTQFYNILMDKYHIQMEMDSVDYVLGIFTVADTREGFNRFLKALTELDAEIATSEAFQKNRRGTGIYPLARKAVEIHKAMDMPRTYIPVDHGMGRIAGEFISLYPPGIPVLTPGEVADEKIITYILKCLKEGLTVHGLNSRGEMGVIDE